MSGQPASVGTLLRAAAAGDFPLADGGFHRLPPWRPGLEAVLAARHRPDTQPSPLVV